jgi:predicted signal transduction protein with EAL and GGDEF domain
VAKVAQLIIDALHQPFDIEGLQLRIGASLGISIFPEHAMDATLLLARADAAMYEAKENGRGIYRFAPDITATE